MAYYKFKILVTVVRQCAIVMSDILNIDAPLEEIGYQAFGCEVFGGEFNFSVIEVGSPFINYILDVGNWSDPFRDTLNKKFPHLLI